MLAILYRLHWAEHLLHLGTVSFCNASMDFHITKATLTEPCPIASYWQYVLPWHFLRKRKFYEIWNIPTRLFLVENFALWYEMNETMLQTSSCQFICINVVWLCLFTFFTWLRIVLMLQKSCLPTIDLEIYIHIYIIVFFS